MNNSLNARVVSVLKRSVFAALVLVAAVGCSSCGYTLAGHGSFLPESIKVIGIPNFVNKTPYLDVEQMLTQRVRTEFIGRGKYKVLPQESDVDALLRVTVNSIALTPSSFNADQQASRYVISVSVGIEFIDMRDNKVLWQNPSQVFREEYALSSGSGTLDPASFFGQASNAVDRMASDFARSVVSAILEAF